VKKNFLLFTVCLLPAIDLPAQSQAGYIDAGLSLIIPWNYQSRAATFPAITVTPGIKMVQGKNFAAILSAPLSIGWRFKDHGYLGIDLPVMFNLHVGSAAGNNRGSRWGFVLGAGAGYINVVNYYDELISVNRHAEFWGYRFRLGVSFKTDEEGTEDLAIPVLFITYGKGISNGRDNMIGIGIHVIISSLKHEAAKEVNIEQARPDDSGRTGNKEY